MCYLDPPRTTSGLSADSPSSASRSEVVVDHLYCHVSSVVSCRPWALSRDARGRGTSLKAIDI